jgi:hypothetical protein
VGSMLLGMLRNQMLHGPLGKGREPQDAHHWLFTIHCICCCFVTLHPTWFEVLARNQVFFRFLMRGFQ